MAASLLCLIRTLNGQLSYLVSFAFNRKASSVADKLCEQYLVRRTVLQLLSVGGSVSATSLLQYKLQLL